MGTGIVTGAAVKMAKQSQPTIDTKCPRVNQIYLNGGLNLLAFVACQWPMHQV